MLRQIKSYYVSGRNILLWRYTEIYRHLLSKYFKNVVLGRQEMMQCKCFDNKQKNVGWGTCKVRKVFGCVAKACYF